MLFTDALDNYLEAKQALDEARAAFLGCDFGYFHSREIQKKEKAQEVLNSFFQERAFDRETPR